MEIILDIETAPLEDVEDIVPAAEDISYKGTAKDPDKIVAAKKKERQKWINKAALSPVTGKVICVGLWEDDSEPVTFTGDDEIEILAKTADMLWGDDRSGTGSMWPTIITYNGKKFDLPFLRYRYMVHGVELPRPDLFFQRPYDDRPHVDLLDLLSDRGRNTLWGKGMSLDEVAKRFGCEAEDAILGDKVSDVYKNIQQGDYEAWDLISEHCKADLIRTRAIYSKIKHYYVEAS